LTDPLPDWIAALASAAPTPGGGGASALAGAVAAALAEMVGQLTAGRARYRDVEPTVRGVLDRLAAYRADLLRLVDADAEAYGGVAAAYALPRATDDERQVRDEAIQQALNLALQPPRQIAVVALDVLLAAKLLAEIGNPSVASDAGCAAILAEASIRCAGLNVLANAVLLRDSDLAKMVRLEHEGREHEAAEVAVITLERVKARMGA
jgi:formiminotetrahydrofolate cyclodeaminase